MHRETGWYNTHSLKLGMEAGPHLATGWLTSLLSSPPAASLSLKWPGEHYLKALCKWGEVS